MVWWARESPWGEDAALRVFWREPALKHQSTGTSWLEIRAKRPHIPTMRSTLAEAHRSRGHRSIAFHFPSIHPEINVSDATSPAITIYSSAICPYCVMAKNFLKSKGLDWTEIRIDLDLAARERMMALARRTSVPQIFVGDVHVGGYDDLIALHRAGKFESMFGGASASSERASGEGA